MSLAPSLNSAGATGTQTGYLSAPAYNPSAPVAPSPVSKALSNFSMGTPQTPVKTQSITHPDGTKVDTTYHAPVDTSTKPPGTQAGMIKQGQSFTDTSGNQGVAQFDLMTGKAYGSTGGSTGTTAPTTPTYAGLIGQGATASQNAANTGAANYAGFTNKAEEAYKTAADTNRVIGQSEANVTHNPSYSLDTGVGLSGLINQNYGLQGQNANAVATGMSNLASTGLTEQGQGISGLGTNAGLLSPTSSIILRDPSTGATIGNQDLSSLAQQQGTLSGIQSGAAAAAGATGGAQATLTANYQSGLAQLRNADNLAPQINQTLASNPTLNQTPISAITNLNQWFAGQTSQPGQQQLSQQVAAYVQALGLTPDQAAAIASQKGGTIGTLLNTLYSAAKAKVDANNPANISAGGGNGTTVNSNSSNTGLFNF